MPHNIMYVEMLTEIVKFVWSDCVKSWCCHCYQHFGP